MPQMSSSASFTYTSKVSGGTMMAIMFTAKDFLSRGNTNTYVFSPWFTDQIVNTITFVYTHHISIPSTLVFTLAHKMCLCYLA